MRSFFLVAFSRCRDSIAADSLFIVTWILLGGAIAAALVVGIVVRRNAARNALRAVHRTRARVARFKLAKKAIVREMLLADPAVAAAVQSHAEENGVSERQVWTQVEVYIDEIVPFFNILTYYRIGLVVSRLLLNFFYKVSAEYSGQSSQSALPRDAVVIYLMNHRSNADYVLVGYVLSGQVAISYAVGEWARVFPLEYIFKSFGAYFIRRKYREKLYHTVLERYVQLITRHGVTQGIFLEGGLSRDGKIGNAKIGLLDYVLGAARDPALRQRLYIIPVAINYDRVLEDRSLLRELDAREGRKRPPKSAQAAEVARYVWWNLARLVARRWKRYGRASVVIGEPLSVGAWLDARAAEGADFFAIDRVERLAQVQALADAALEKIAALIPVTPVSLACAALQSLDGDFVTHARLVERMSDMRDVLRELNARVIHRDGDVEEIFDRAWRMLSMRRILVKTGSGYSVLPHSRPLISYYANSVAHLLGPFANGVRARDSLPAVAAGIVNVL